MEYQYRVVQKRNNLGKTAWFVTAPTRDPVGDVGPYRWRWVAQNNANNRNRRMKIVKWETVS